MSMATGILPPHLAVTGSTRARIMDIMAGHEMTWCPELAAARRNGVKSLAEPLQRFVRVYSTPAVTRAGNAAFVRVDGPLCSEAGWLYDSIEAITHEAMVRTIDALIADQSVSTIVLDLACPGWSSDGSSDVLAALKRARASKRLLARVHDMAASGGMWMAAYCEEISASPTGWVGSIGSLIYTWDTSEAFKRAGITPVVIASDPDKACGHPGVQASDIWKAMLQRVVDLHTDAFFKDVATARGITVDAIREMKAGMFATPDALEKRLIDRIEEHDAYVARVATLPAKQTTPAPGQPAANQKGKIMDLTTLTLEQLAGARPDIVAAIAGKAVKDEQVKATAPATFTQLKEAFGTDAEHILACQEKSLSMGDAHKAYAAAMRARLDAANAKISELEKAPGKKAAKGEEPLAEGGQKSASSGMHPFIARAKAIDAEKKCGIAMAMQIAQREPGGRELHAEYVEVAAAAMKARARKEQ